MAVDLEKITKSWGEPKTEKEKSVFQAFIDLLREIITSKDLPYIWETFLVQNNISVGTFEKWEQMYSNKRWFRNAITDIKMLFADNIVRNAKVLGAENMKYLLHRLIEDQEDEKEIVVHEILEVKQ